MMTKLQTSCGLVTLAKLVELPNRRDIWFLRSKSISLRISFQPIRHFSFCYICFIIMNHYLSPFKWKASHDILSSVLCRQGSNDKYKREIKPCQWLFWSNLLVLHKENHLHIYRWTKVHLVQASPCSSTKSISIPLKEGHSCHSSKCKSMDVMEESC